MTNSVTSIFSYLKSSVFVVRIFEDHELAEGSPNQPRDRNDPTRVITDRTILRTRAGGEDIFAPNGPPQDQGRHDVNRAFFGLGEPFDLAELGRRGNRYRQPFQLAELAGFGRNSRHRPRGGDDMIHTRAVAERGGVRHEIDDL